MSKHAGPRPTRPKPVVPRSRLVLLAIGVTATLVAWGYLVFAAIEFGKEARAGEPAAWTFLVLATIGAAACLFMTLLLGTRVADLFRRNAPTLPAAERPPARTPGRRALR